MSIREAFDANDAVGLAGLVRNEDVTPEELLDECLRRVEAVNPRLNAVVHRLDEMARRQIAAGLPDGPFAGVPFVLKDLFMFEAGRPCGNGSRLFDGFVADHDTEVARRYRAAGLVVCGRTNTPEFGLSATTEPVASGPCHNPWNLDHTPGGSSGGAAAAVAAGMLPAAHATDGGGSIRIPASCCGLVGLKPSRGRSSHAPDVGEGWSGLSSAHAVTRSVRDSAGLLDAITGPMPGDPYTAPPPIRPFAREVGVDPGRLRIGFSDRTAAGDRADSECSRAVRAATDLCADLGHEVSEAGIAFDVEALKEAMEVIIAANTANMLDMVTRSLGRPADEATVERVTLGFAERGRRFSSADYARAVQVIHKTGRQMAVFFETFDLALTPTLFRPPPKLGEIDMMEPDMDVYMRHVDDFIPFTPPYNVSGAPAISLPLHVSEAGLPIGVQFAARYGDEAILIRLAAQLESAQPWAGRMSPIAAQLRL